MKTLTEFLKEQAERERGQAESAKALRDDWIAAVDRLTGQMIEWLRQADQDQVLTIKLLPRTMSEEGMGFYDVNGLSIRLGAREIRVEPAARKVIGPYVAADGGRRIRAQGMVDLVNGQRRYRLYRFKEPNEHWVIIDEEQDYAMRDFDREAFEVAVQRMLE